MAFRRHLPVTLALAWVMACTGDGPSEPAIPPALSVTSAPPTARATAAIAPGVVVRVEPASFSGSITAAIDSGTGTLQGTTTVQASRGNATFSDLRIAGVGRFVLRFSTPGAADVRSGPILVSPDSGSRLVVRTAISANVVSGTTFASQPVIEVRAPNGTVLTFPVLVQATLVRGNGVLTGSTTATSNAGAAAFSGLGAEGFNTATVRFSAFGFQSIDANIVIQIFGLYVRPRLPNGLDTMTVARDDAVDVTIRLVTGPNDVVGSARFDVVWDPRMLTLLADQVFTGNALINRNQLGEGVLQVTLTTATGLSGTPDVLFFRFRAERVTGEAPISTRILDVRSPEGRDIYRSNVSSTVRVFIP
ncbi:MAG: hypothetical protein ACRENH_09570 [Gemmatimonadaceae bacterium]